MRRIVFRISSVFRMTLLHKSEEINENKRVAEFFRLLLRFHCFNFKNEFSNNTF